MSKEKLNTVNEEEKKKKKKKLFLILGCILGAGALAGAGVGIYYAVKPSAPQPGPEPEPEQEVDYDTFLKAVTRLYKPEEIEAKYVGYNQIATFEEGKSETLKISEFHVEDGGFAYFLYEGTTDTPEYDAILNPSLVINFNELIGEWFKEVNYYINGEEYSVRATFISEEDKNDIEEFTFNKEMVVTHFTFEGSRQTSIDITYEK